MSIEQMVDKIFDNSKEEIAHTKMRIKNGIKSTGIKIRRKCCMYKERIKDKTDKE